MLTWIAEDPSTDQQEFPIFSVTHKEGKYAILPVKAIDPNTEAKGNYSATEINRILSQCLQMPASRTTQPKLQQKSKMHRRRNADKHSINGGSIIRINIGN